MPKPPDLLSRMGGGLGARVQAASWISALAGLVWPLQAYLVATVFGWLLVDNQAPVWPLIGGFVALGLLRAGMAQWADALLQATARDTITAARATILATEQMRSGAAEFGGAGAVAALGGPKLDMLAPYITRYRPARLRVLLISPVILVLSFWQAWVVGVVLLVAGPLIPVFMALVGWAAKEASARQLQEIGSLNDLLIERLAALPDIRSLGANAQVRAGFAAKAQDLRNRTMAVLRVAFLSSAVLELFSALGVALVAVFVGFSLLNVVTFGTWGAQLDPAAGIFLLLLAPEFFQPLRDLAAAWHDKAAADSVADEFARWQDSGGDTCLGTGGPAAALSGPASISISGVVLPDGRALPDLTIAPGERVALIGASGSGKSTLLRVMAGLVVLRGAQVTVAGHRLDRATADGWRARLGWMAQTPHFLNASLRRNVDLGRADPAELARALQAANIAPVVAALPRGLNTRLGETGAGLSGGEGRRVVLARAIYGQPDIVLADEPTADLDAVTAAAVTRTLLAQAERGATLVIATHDPALASQMDRVIDLGAGA